MRVCVSADTTNLHNVLPSILQQETRVSEPLVRLLPAPDEERERRRRSAQAIMYSTRRPAQSQKPHYAAPSRRLQTGRRSGLALLEHEKPAACRRLLSRSGCGSHSRRPRRPPPQAMEISRARGLMPPITGDKRLPRADHWHQSHSVGCEPLAAWVCAPCCSLV